MFPVSAETTVSASEQAHLPSNMFSIPQAEHCTAQLRKCPPTERMAEPRNVGNCACMRTGDHRHPAGGAVGRGSEDGRVKLHFTVTSKQARGFSFPSFLPFCLPPSLPPSPPIPLNELAASIGCSLHTSLTQVAGSWLEDDWSTGF